MMAAKHINSSTQTMLMATLSTLSPRRLSLITNSISTVSHHYHNRLATLLYSPILFSISLRFLRSLSLREKSLLIARHLHSNLLILLKHLHKNHTATAPSLGMKLQDLDATLLMLLISEIHQHDKSFLHAPPSRWRVRLLDYFSDSVLSTYRLGEFSKTGVLIEYVENVDMCWNFVRLMGFGGSGEVAAAAEVVVRLPSVEVIGGGVECVICTEEMRGGREVCEMPCGHLFHWGCILRWLRKTNTCPCCRHCLPTNDVHREIERIMEEFAKVGDWECGGGFCMENAHNIA